MKNKKGFTLIELVIVVMIILILAATLIPLVIKMNKDDDVIVNIKPTENFSQDDLYSKEKFELKEVTKEVPEEVKKELLFYAKLVGKMDCDGCLGNLKVYEFCYNGVKYFTIYGGYMAPKMKKESNGVVHYETCD